MPCQSSGPLFQVEGINPDIVKKIIRHHIRTSWSDLLPAFDQMLEKPSLFLYYDGPQFRIFRKTPFRLAEQHLLNVTESHDLHSAPIYLDKPQGDLLPDHPAEKRSRLPTSNTMTVFSPPSSPSQQRRLKKRKEGI